MVGESTNLAKEGADGRLCLLVALPHLRLLVHSGDEPARLACTGFCFSAGASQWAIALGPNPKHAGAAAWPPSSAQQLSLVVLASPRPAGLLLAAAERH